METNDLIIFNHGVGMILRVSQTIAASLRTRRGKSELHRAGCWITSSGGDSKDSATEINRLDLSR